MLGNDQIQLVINLTIPAAHVPVSLAALNAGKHVWSEKPMALDRAGAAQLLEAAKKNSVRLGIAPDTFLGAGVQSALNSIRGGSIGEPLTALTIFQTAGIWIRASIVPYLIQTLFFVVIRAELHSQ